MQICWPLLFNMFDTLFCQWVRHIFRMMGLTAVFRSKSLGLMCFILCTGLYFIYFKLTELSELQKQNIDIVKRQSLVIEANNGRHVVLPSTLTYWLAAKSADSPHMKHVRNVFTALGFERWNDKSNSWDVAWTYDYPFPSKISSASLSLHQKVNHFPGSGYLTSKVFLAKSKSRHIPVAFELPKDKELFLTFAKEQPSKLWVQKSNQHRGIRIKAVDELDLAATSSFIQEFIQDPFLIDGRKFDVGIYVIITSVDPLRVYIYNGDWLLRFCPEDYLPLDVANPRKYVVEDDYTPTWEMPSLRDYHTRLKLSHEQSLLAYIRGQDLDADDLKKRLYSAVADITLDKQRDIVKSLAKYPWGSRNFFEMVRFDFVFDSKLNIFLMEVNMSPNLSSAHFSANALLYEQVLFNTLHVAGIVNLRYKSSRAGVTDDTLVSDQDIQVYEKECKACHDCKQSETCKLCVPCMSADVKAAIKSAYSEHLNRMQCVRAFPRPKIYASTNADDKLTTANDKLLKLWFDGMCRKWDEWCQ